MEVVFKTRVKNEGVIGGPCPAFRGKFYAFPAFRSFIPCFPAFRHFSLHLLGIFRFSVTQKVSFSGFEHNDVLGPKVAE